MRLALSVVAGLELVAALGQAMPVIFTRGRRAIPLAPAVAGGGFATPDIFNNLSFETGWDGLVDGSNGTPTGVIRATDQAFDGITSIKGTWAATPGGDGSVGDLWGDFHSQNDRVFVRYYFRLAAGWSITSILKFFTFRYDTSIQFGGWELDDTKGLSFSFFNEASAIGASIVPKASITVDAWHWIEVDCKRNGDALPNCAFWFDGSPITKADGADPATSNITWASGRAFFGPRGLSQTIGMFRAVSPLNQGNTGTGTMWIDKLAVSTSRIGP